VKFCVPVIVVDFFLNTATVTFLQRLASEFGGGGFVLEQCGRRALFWNVAGETLCWSVTVEAFCWNVAAEVLFWSVTMETLCWSVTGSFMLEDCSRIDG
jgi:hypothetical protein